MVSRSSSSSNSSRLTPSSLHTASTDWPGLRATYGTRKRSRLSRPWVSLDIFSPLAAVQLGDFLRHLRVPPHCFIGSEHFRLCSQRQQIFEQAVEISRRHLRAALARSRAGKKFFRQWSELTFELHL